MPSLGSANRTWPRWRRSIISMLLPQERRRLTRRFRDQADRFFCGASKVGCGAERVIPRQASVSNLSARVARVRGTAAASFGVGQASRPAPAANGLRLPRNVGGRQSPERLARWRAPALTRGRVPRVPDRYRQRRTGRAPVRSHLLVV
jgi:hypothetical protein